MKKIFSKEEKKEVKCEIKNAFKQYKKEIQDYKKRQVKDTFVDMFKICESIYKILLKKYLNIKSEEEKDLKLHLKQIEAVLKCAEIEIDKNIVDKIFNTQNNYSKVGSRSAKVLRNKIVHTMDISAIEEVIKRKKELFSDMNCFINVLKK